MLALDEMVKAESGQMEFEERKRRHMACRDMYACKSVLRLANALKYGKDWQK